MREQERFAIEIIEEFVSDVKKHGPEIAREDWPELFVTYQFAVKFIATSRTDRSIGRII